MTARRRPRVLIIDYGMGNVRSVLNALQAAGCDAVVSSDPAAIPGVDAFVLPGVGAFGEAMRNLRALGAVERLAHEVIERRKPLLGICLGMQLLATTSEEGGRHDGVGWIPAQVRLLKPGGRLRVPHVGWTEIDVVRPHPLFEGLDGDRSFYFVHSYVFECESSFVSARFQYGTESIAAIQSGNIFGTQFHPEKSSANGLRVLRNFVNYVVQWA